MTAASTPPPIYPQYCFHLSPTLNRWCPLRAKDIDGLWAHSGFAGQDLFFHLNHPIKWVRVAGVIVAIDEYADSGRRIYTVDDSSGVNIECLVTFPKPGSADAAKTEATESGAALPKAQVPSDLDIGQVVDVKGGLGQSREHKQIKVEKVAIMKSTQAEVNFWTKRQQFRKDVLAEPWALDKNVVRKCRKEAEASFEEEQERGRRKKKRKDREATVRENSKRHQGLGRAAPAIPKTQTGSRNEVDRSREQSSHTTQGKFNALGL